MTKKAPEIDEIVQAIRSRDRFVISSHSRPDGDSIGSQLAMAYALRALGKTVHVVNKDPAAAPIMAFPGVQDIERYEYRNRILFRAYAMASKADHLVPWLGVSLGWTL